MTEPLNMGNCCCAPSMSGVRKITMPDGDQVGLIGLDDVLDAFYREGKPATDATAIEMIDRLSHKNYISDNPSAQMLYKQALLAEYRHFIEKKKR